jgi:hypothetical protein
MATLCDSGVELVVELVKFDQRPLLPAQIIQSFVVCPFLDDVGGAMLGVVVALVSYISVIYFRSYCGSDFSINKLILSL